MGNGFNRGGTANQLKISIVIPVYNAEKYIERTIQSILLQTYKNLEILLVDDASTDGSLDICKRFAGSDSRIIVVENKQNGGSGFSKNVGISYMTGDALCFVDDDDVLVDENILADCVAIMVEQKADIVCFGWCDNEPEKGYHHYVFEKPYSMTGTEAVEKLLCCDGLDSNPWCKVYKKEVYENLSFPTGMVYDDANVTYKAFMKAMKVVNLGILGYSHISSGDSISGSAYKERDWDYITNVQKTVKDLSDASMALQKNAQIMLSKASIDLLVKYSHGGDMPKDKLAYLKKEYDKSYKYLISKSQSIKEKIIMSMIHHNMMGIVRIYYKLKNRSRS